MDITEVVKNHLAYIDECEENDMEGTTREERSWMWNYSTLALAYLELAEAQPGGTP